MCRARAVSPAEEVVTNVMTSDDLVVTPATARRVGWSRKAPIPLKSWSVEPAPVRIIVAVVPVPDSPLWASRMLYPRHTDAFVGYEVNLVDSYHEP